MVRNGWINGVLAAILLTLPIGSVYAFSLFAPGLAEACGVSLAQMQYAFSLSIFFLGMGAAFFGPIVEKNPGKAGLIASLLYLCGMSLTGIGANMHNYALVILGYGVCNGLGQGIGYLSPVKALMMWFPNNKGLSASVSIVSFGLGSTLCTFLAKSTAFGLDSFFFFLACLYTVMMMLGSLLLKKPDVTQNCITVSQPSSFSYKKLFTDRMFWHSWIFMFLNISAGLALIGCSVSIFKDASISQSAIVVLMMLAGIFNGSFRLIFAWMSDFLKIRINVWFVISALSILFMAIAGLNYQTIGIAVLLINATYGGGFSTLPAVLSDYYDNSQLSRTHGAVLSAWAMAGLVGNNISMLVFNASGGFYWLIWLLVGIYAINLVNVYFAKKMFVEHISTK